jgi:hypothetical protein
MRVAAPLKNFHYPDVANVEFGIDAARVAHTMNPLETAEVPRHTARDAENPRRER